MSRHIFQTTHNEQPAVIVMGWDRPLRGFHLTVHYKNSDADQPLYSNMFDTELLPYQGMPPDIDYLLEKLQSLGLEVPESMVEQVCIDSIFNEGNRQVIYNQAGEVVEPEPVKE